MPRWSRCIPLRQRRTLMLADQFSVHRLLPFAASAPPTSPSRVTRADQPRLATILTFLLIFAVLILRRPTGHERCPSAAVGSHPIWCVVERNTVLHSGGGCATVASELYSGITDRSGDGPGRFHGLGRRRLGAGGRTTESHGASGQQQPLKRR